MANDVLNRIDEIIKESISVVDVSLKDQTILEYEENVYLLDLLLQLQYKVAELREDLAEILHKEILEISSRSNRRIMNKDRRKISTFIASDRRSGIADRRKRAEAK